MRLTRWVLWVLLIGWTFSGCSAIKSCTEATVGFMRGQYVQYTAHKVSTVCIAAGAALDELKVEVSKRGCDELTGRLVARNSQEAKITIKINRTGENLTRTGIQIGALGDRKQSMVIYDMIQKRLPDLSEK